MEAERGVREAGLSSLADGVDVESGGERNSGSRLDSWSCVLDIVSQLGARGGGWMILEPRRALRHTLAGEWLHH